MVKHIERLVARDASASGQAADLQEVRARVDQAWDPRHSLLHSLGGHLGQFLALQNRRKTGFSGARIGKPRLQFLYLASNCQEAIPSIPSYIDCSGVSTPSSFLDDRFPDSAPDHPQFLGPLRTLYPSVCFFSVLSLSI